MSHQHAPAPCPIPLAPREMDEMGRPEGHGYTPGDWMFLRHAEGHPCPDWDNCTGFHYVVLPCGCLFDTGHRASNCTMPNDRTHRCWVIAGTFPNVTLSKNGHTCQAGAGSIGHPHWHGFIRGGQLVT